MAGVGVGVMNGTVPVAATASLDAAAAVVTAWVEEGGAKGVGDADVVVEGSSSPSSADPYIVPEGQSLFSQRKTRISLDCAALDIHKAGC